MHLHKNVIGARLAAKTGMRLEKLNRFLQDSRAKPYMKNIKGIATVAGGLAVVLTMSGYTYQSYQSKHAENRKLANELALIEGEAAKLRYEMYERSSREPLSGKPLVVNLIAKAVEIEGLNWDEKEIEAMADICWRESRYNPNDQNPVSTAYGLYQFLDSTWQYYDVEKTSDPLLQTVAAARYIKDRYETPTQALEFHEKLHAINGRMVHYY